MKFNRHPEYEGKHALLSASQHSWLRYDEETLINRYISSYQSDIGTAVHELANHLITNKIKINRNCKPLIISWLSLRNFPRNVYNADEILCNLEAFVNDCIAFHMQSEVVLFYSPEAFGTTDAISVDLKNKKLRISDYKNGKSDVSMEQPIIYSAYFFLEYTQIEGVKINPSEWTVECRIYQNCEIQIYSPTPDEIIKIMDIIREDVRKVQIKKGVIV